MWLLGIGCQHEGREEIALSDVFNDLNLQVRVGGNLIDIKDIFAVYLQVLINFIDGRNRDNGGSVVHQLGDFIHHIFIVFIGAEKNLPRLDIQAFHRDPVF